MLTPPPAGSEALSLAPGPMTPSDIRTLFTAVDIYRSLGGLEKAVDILETTTRSNVEKIEQLIRKTDQTAFAVPIIENAISQHGKDLNELGRIAHTAKTLGQIALTFALSGIGVAILVYLYRHLLRLLVK
jgi:hypothetical protein